MPHKHSLLCDYQTSDQHKVTSCPLYLLQTPRIFWSGGFRSAGATPEYQRKVQKLTFVCACQAWKENKQCMSGSCREVKVFWWSHYREGTFTSVIFELAVHRLLLSANVIKQGRFFAISLLKNVEKSAEPKKLEVTSFKCKTFRWHKAKGQRKALVSSSGMPALNTNQKHTNPLVGQFTGSSLTKNSLKNALLELHLYPSPWFYARQSWL